MDYLSMIVLALIVVLVAKFLLGLNMRKLTALIINFLLGILVLWLLNTFGGPLGIAIPINVITVVIVGITGLPGVVLLVLLSLIGVI